MACFPWLVSQERFEYFSKQILLTIYKFMNNDVFNNNMIYKNQSKIKKVIHLVKLNK